MKPERMEVDRPERRGSKRLAISVKVKASRIGKDTSHRLNAYLLETKDITPGGLFLRTAKPLPADTRLKIEIELMPDRPPVSAEGEVAWIAKKSQRGYYPGMGIRITKIKRGENNRLGSFLKEKFRNYHQALELKRMYLQLKEMAGRLYELEESHPHAEHFRNVIDGAIKEIDSIAHILDREVWEVKSL